MKIAVIGAGAMGSIYGGHLSLNNEVYLVDTKPAIVEEINKNGLKLQEDGKDVLYHPKAVTSAEGLPKMDLIILFVKSLFSKAALESNGNLIGENTYVMTLQNGSGHEDILKAFVQEDHIIIGTTEDNGAVLAPGYVRHGGYGNTNIGMLNEDKDNFMDKVKESFDQCGFNVKIHENIQQLIWDKLFTNVSLSAVTAVLQVDIGYIASNPHAWKMTQQLIKEAATVARTMGLEADDDEIITKVKATSEGSPNGCTSIRADIRDGRKTEVDTISGAVLKAAQKYDVEVPTHAFVVDMIHGLEGKA